MKRGAMILAIASTIALSACGRAGAPETPAPPAGVTMIPIDPIEPKDGGTLCRDIGEYQHRGGPIIERLLVRRDVERIFEYRRQKMLELFGGNEQ